VLVLNFNVVKNEHVCVYIYIFVSLVNYYLSLCNSKFRLFKNQKEISTHKILSFYMINSLRIMGSSIIKEFISKNLSFFSTRDKVCNSEKTLFPKKPFYFFYFMCFYFKCFVSDNKNGILNFTEKIYLLIFSRFLKRASYFDVWEVKEIIVVVEKSSVL
jgi:hypothetical protein